MAWCLQGLWRRQKSLRTFFCFKTMLALFFDWPKAFFRNFYLLALELPSESPLKNNMSDFIKWLSFWGPFCAYYVSFLCPSSSAWPPFSWNISSVFRLLTDRYKYMYIHWIIISLDVPITSLTIVTLNIQNATVAWDVANTN